MVQPKTIGENLIADSKSPAERRHDLQVVVPIKNEIRNVEAFDTTPSPGVQEIITSENSTFKFLRFARIVLNGSQSANRMLAEMKNAVYYINRGEASFAIEGKIYTLEKGDVLYVGTNSQIQVSS